MSLKFCLIIESNSQKTFSTIVLYTNMGAVMSRENQELLSSLSSCCLETMLSFTLWGGMQSVIGSH